MSWRISNSSLSEILNWWKNIIKLTDQLWLWKHMMKSHLISRRFLQKKTWRISLWGKQCRWWLIFRHQTLRRSSIQKFEIISYFCQTEARLDLSWCEVWVEPNNEYLFRDLSPVTSWIMHVSVEHSRQRNKGFTDHHPLWHHCAWQWRCSGVLWCGEGRLSHLRHVLSRLQQQVQTWQRCYKQQHQPQSDERICSGRKYFFLFFIHFYKVFLL